jgi:hypothetical protein
LIVDVVVQDADRFSSGIRHASKLNPRCNLPCDITR